MDEGDEGERSPTVVKDWRWALGALGKVLITLGLLILAFVGYQLWGTGIEFRANQDSLGKDFARALSTSTTVPESVVATAPIDTTPDSTTAGSVVSPTTTTTPEITAPTTTDRPRAGTLLASLEMPTISSKSLYIVAGVRTTDLKRGIGFYPGTAPPGDYGNTALAGHRTTYGAPFENIDRLRSGDPLIITTIDGRRLVYLVERSEIVSPEDTTVLLQPDDTEQALLTLTTCHPKRSTKQRLVVHARLDPTQSSAPYRSPAATNPTSTVANAGTSTSTTVTDTVTPTTSPAAVSTSTSTSNTGSTITGSANTGTEDAAEEPADADDLARGWFHDTGAWPQILLWGALLGAITLGGRWAGRRLGRRWLGVVMAAVPFVVVLYFVFQNINRLLPPGF